MAEETKQTTPGRRKAAAKAAQNKKQEEAKETKMEEKTEEVQAEESTAPEAKNGNDAGAADQEEAIERMSICEAIEKAKEGVEVTRDAWDRLGVSLVIKRGDTLPMLKTASGRFSPFTPSTPDVMTKDWKEK